MTAGGPRRAGAALALGAGAALALGAGLAAVAACTLPPLRPPPRLPACPGPIPSPRTLGPGDATWRDHARYRGGDVDASFSLVAEKRGRRLTLVGFDAFGARVFSVVHEGGDLESRSRLGPALAVPPETVLRDWYAQRARAAGSEEAVELARPDCGYSATWVRGRAADAPLNASPSP